LDGYRLRKITSVVHTKRKYKTEERWFCLPEGNGADLPPYVREGAHRKGYKTFNAFFAQMGYYRSADFVNKCERIDRNTKIMETTSDENQTLA